VANQPIRHRFTVDEYEQMGVAGVFAPDVRLELLDGEIVEMNPIGSRHAACVKRLHLLLTEALGRRAVIGVQDPTVVGSHTEAQPDISVLRWNDDFYASAHPRSDDVLLLVEVADTSVSSDRRVKLPVYATGGIAECWLVDLNAEVVEVYRRSAGGTYKERRDAARGETVSPTAFPEVTLAVDDILGERSSRITLR